MSMMSTMESVLAKALAGDQKVRQRQREKIHVCARDARCVPECVPDRKKGARVCDIWSQRRRGYVCVCVCEREREICLRKTCPQQERWKTASSFFSACVKLSEEQRLAVYAWYFLILSYVDRRACFYGRMGRERNCFLHTYLQVRQNEFLVATVPHSILPASLCSYVRMHTCRPLSRLFPASCFC